MKLRKNVKIKSEVRQALKNIGLTDYLINIYVGLLKDGEMNARELSELTQVPYSRIYEVLNEMVRKKMITKIDGRPSTFLPNNPRDVLNFIKSQQDNQFQDDANISLPFLKNMFGEKKQAKQDIFMIYQGEKPCQDHIRNVLNATSRTLWVALNNMRDLFPNVQMHLEFLKTKGVEMRFLLENQNKRDDFIQILEEYGEVNYLPWIDSNLLISDEKTTFQGLKGSFNIANPRQKEYVLFSSTSAMYVIYSMEIFHRLWKRALDKS